jgi:hypothetical protein
VTTEGNKNIIAGAFSRRCVITIDDEKEEEHQDLCARFQKMMKGGVDTTPRQTRDGKSTATNSQIPLRIKLHKQWQNHSSHEVVMMKLHETECQMDNVS